jgi:hypothetical protein
MKPNHLSRRDFLRLTSLGFFGLATRPGWARILLPASTRTQVLSEAQQARLIAAARKYLAPDDASATQIAIVIDFVEGPFEGASNMCGPLSVRILQDADLLGRWVSRNDFWLLNPRDNLDTLQETFPPELYHWYGYETPFRDHDFEALPLMAGDFVYLTAGPSDTFEHIFVVTRVDDAGRAYTVSNFLTDAGMVIEERLLYNPQQPGVGQVYDWADRSIRNTIGIAGSGGYQIWRIKHARDLEFPQDGPAGWLRDALDDLLLGSTAAWYAQIEEVGGPLLYQFSPYSAFFPASTIKMPIALAAYAWLEEQDYTNWEAFIEEQGAGGRSYQQLLSAMLVESEEEATEALVAHLSEAALKARWQSWGVADTQISPRRSSVRDLRTCFLAAYQGNRLSERSRQHLLDLLSAYTVNDDGRLGRLKQRVSTPLTIYNKRASLVSGPMTVADSGIVVAGSRRFFFTASSVGGAGSSYEGLEAELNRVVDLFGFYLAATLRKSGKSPYIAR